MYCVFWRKGLQRPALDFRPASWCSNCEAVVSGVQWWKKASKGSLRTEPGKFMWGRYGQQYLYACPRCLQNVAPAVVGAKSIIDWTTPMARIGDRHRPLAVKTRERIRTGLKRLSTSDPVTVQVGGHLFERPGYARVWSVEDPLRTVTGSQYMSVVVPKLSERTSVILRSGGQSPAPVDTRQPMGTITAHDRQLSLLAPPNGNGNGKHKEMLVRVNRGGDRRAQALEEPMPTVAGHGEMALVSFRKHGDARPVEIPAHTVTAGGYHHGVLVYNGSPGFVRSLDDAAGTVTGRDKQSLLVPYTNGNGKTTELPVGTSKDREALIISEQEIDDCLFRMLQWPELLAAQQMHLMPDGSPYQLKARRKNARGKYVDLSNELRVKMIGNAVSSPVATMLGRAVVESLLAA
jgi:hypothetical protein